MITEYGYKRLLRFLIWSFLGFITIIIGISNVFADTSVDASSFINVTGRKWSEGLLEYTGNPSYNTDWLLNSYNVTGGLYTPPNIYDYIEFSYFEHNTGQFNPCNSSGKFTAEFRLLFTNSSFNQYVNSIKWNDDTCSVQERNQDGTMKVSCVASPSSSNSTGIYVNYNDIQGTATSNLYISRDIDITCGLNTDAIINNDNANTQNIINNNNQNTQDIINNNNQNTQDLIDSNKVCKDYDSGSIDSDYAYGFLNSSGSYYTTGNTAGYGVSEYININNSDVTVTSTVNTNIYACFYNVDKEKISCINESTLVVDSNLSVPSGAYYIRLSIQKSQNKPTIRVCKNGNQALDDSINNLDDTINDDDTTGAESEASEFFSSFDTETFGLTSIITAPLNLIRSVLSSTCSDLQLPLPYLSNKYLTLPCMTTIYTEHFGTFFTIYQTITYGIIAYWVCVRIFNQVKDFKNPEHDEIEVMDL